MLFFFFFNRALLLYIPGTGNYNPETNRRPSFIHGSQPNKTKHYQSHGRLEYAIVIILREELL